MEILLKSRRPAKLRVSQSGTINPDSFSPSEVNRLPPSYGPLARAIDFQFPANHDFGILTVQARAGGPCHIGAFHFRAGDSLHYITHGLIFLLALQPGIN